MAALNNELTEAHRELLNWGRWARDFWPAPELGYVPPPTSQEYLAPIVGWDEPMDEGVPIDPFLAEITESVVVKIGMENIDYYRVLVRWYPKLMAGPPIPIEECYKRLAKFMHCSYRGAKRMREDALKYYAMKRLTYGREKKRAAG